MIPKQYAGYFGKAAEDLNSHKGIDFGALDVFGILSGKFADFSLSSKVSRLLVEVNRSINSLSLFSAYSQQMPVKAKEKILNNYYHPYRKKITDKVKEFVYSGNNVLHISVHSFTPVLNGEIRKNDIGLLFDPDNKMEQYCCNAWKKTIEKIRPDMVVMFNYPYLGTTDGLTKTLREAFPEKYAGIELEINQKYYANNSMDKDIVRVIELSIEKALKENETVTNWLC